MEESKINNLCNVGDSLSEFVLDVSQPIISAIRKV